MILGNAGTGDFILKNWEEFSFELREESENMYIFNVEFLGEEGHMVICTKKGDIDGGTTLDIKFDRPLSANNDTVNFNSGLFQVARKMLEEI